MKKLWIGKSKHVINRMLYVLTFILCLGLGILTFCVMFTCTSPIKPAPLIVATIAFPLGLIGILYLISSIFKTEID